MIGQKFKDYCESKGFDSHKAFIYCFLWSVNKSDTTIELFSKGFFTQEEMMHFRIDLLDTEGSFKIPIFQEYVDETFEEFKIELANLGIYDKGHESRPLPYSIWKNPVQIETNYKLVKQRVGLTTKELAKIVCLYYKETDMAKSLVNLLEPNEIQMAYRRALKEDLF